MRIRLKFEKTGRLKYIGHLDLLDIFNRAIKAAKLPIEYSKGFNPHMLIAFANPLSLGMESVAEYVDIDFAEFEPSFNERINAKFPEGLRITGSYALTQPYTRIASIVKAAEYDIIGIPNGVSEISADTVERFMAQGDISVMKKTKRRNEVCNIRPDIFKVQRVDGALSVILACGSFENLKPSLFLEALFSFADISVPLYKLQMIRRDILDESLCSIFRA